MTRLRSTIVTLSVVTVALVLLEPPSGVATALAAVGDRDQSDRARGRDESPAVGFGRDVDVAIGLDELAVLEEARAETERLLEELEARVEARQAAEGPDAGGRDVSRIHALYDRLRAIDREMDGLQIDRVAQSRVRGRALREELDRVRDVADRAERARMEAERAYVVLARRQLELRQQAGGVAMGLEAIADEIAARDSRIRDLEIEGEVARFTVDFLRGRIEQLMGRVERGIAEDAILQRLREAEQQARLRYESGSAPESAITDVMERRAERERVLAEQLGRDLMVELESRVLSAELEARSIEVRQERLRQQVAELMDAMDPAAAADRLEALELPMAVEAVRAAEERLRATRREVRRLEWALERHEEPQRPEAAPGGPGLGDGPGAGGGR